MLDATVIVPTYNRADILDLTLRSLARQDVPRDSFEVIVGDDGSADHTAEVVAAHGVGRVWQPDEGFRVAAARNLAAASATGRILIFVDSGVVVVPWFVREHLRAHDESPQHRVVLGCVYGYTKLDQDCGFTAADMHARRPEELLAAMRDHGRQADLREENFQQVGDDLERLAAPWTFCWTSNMSVRTDVFRALGGFDEEFTGWGGEDTEFGCRMHDAGARFVLRRHAAAIEYPHPRDREANLRTHEANQNIILRKHTRPLVEAATVCRARVLDRRWRELTDVLRARRPVVTKRARSPVPGRVVLFGADTVLDVDLCVDPDPAALAAFRAAAPDVPVLTLFGFRTLLDEHSFDACLLSASLRSYPDWAVELLEREAARIARTTVWLQEEPHDRSA